MTNDAQMDYNYVRKLMEIAAAEAAWEPASQCPNCGSINHLVAFGKCAVCHVVIVETTGHNPDPALD